MGAQSIANNNLRFEQLLKELRPHDYPSHHTLFRINFICQRDPVKPQEFAGIKLTVIPSKSQGALYDLHIFLIMRTEGWRLACEYNTDLFDAGTITGLLGDYHRVLESIVENPDRRISEFPPSKKAALARQRKSDTESVLSPSAKVIPAEAAPSALEPFAMPTSAAQRRFWVLEEFTPGNPALHMRACVRLTGSLSRATLEKSLRFLVERHETLRTTFARADEEIIQVISRLPKIPLPLTSLEDVPEADRETKLWEAIRVEASTPFDLFHGPLIRSRLFRLDPHEHVLMITTHHILTDGWSQNVIQRDLWTIYEALAEDREPALPALAIQYGDFVHWQQKWLASESAREQVDFWQKQLAPPLSVLDFPAERPSRERVPQGSMETLLLPEDLTRSLKILSQSQDATMFMVMLTAYSALLNRYTGQEDILIGAPVANRRTETEPLIGPFAGPVSLRMNLSGNPTLIELLDRVRDTTLNALGHADLPFEVLLEELHVRSVQGRNPLSQCYFFYQVAFLQPRQLPELKVTPLPDFGLGTHFELQMGLLERREGVRAQLEYNPALFEAATIKDILGLYETVLRAFVADPQRRLSDLPFLRTKPVVAAPAHVSEPNIAPPEDEAEKQLTEIWEEILGCRPIGRDQNYFDLGGNSLLAVRLFAQVERAFKIKLPLSTLIEAQTIARLARLLRSDTSAPDWSPLVEIQSGGSRPPFFCVHGAGGNVLIYRDLARRLGPDQPFYGLQSQGLDGEQPLLTRIEDMAALYVKEIRRVQLRGPYLLGGYCMGGTVALEMAQQLKAQGEQVGLLALFDTMNWSNLNPATVWDKAYYQTQRVIFHARSFLLLNFVDKIKFFREKLAILRGRTSVWRGTLQGRLSVQPATKKGDALLLARIWQTNDHATADYVPRPYPGVITDFRPMQQYTRYQVPGLHWDEMALEGQDIVTLPVYPGGMLLEPFVKHLAAALRTSIDKAIQPVSSSVVCAAVKDSGFRLAEFRAADLFRVVTAAVSEEVH